MRKRWGQGPMSVADDDGALRQVDVIPAQIASFRHTQTVPVDDPSDQPIPMAVPVALEYPQQLVHLSLGQVLPDPVGVVLRRPFERLVALRTFWPAEPVRFCQTFLRLPSSTDRIRKQ
jgi:hypothetical protein